MSILAKTAERNLMPFAQLKMRIHPLNVLLVIVMTLNANSLPVFHTPQVGVHQLLRRVEVVAVVAVEHVVPATIKGYPVNIRCFSLFYLKGAGWRIFTSPLLMFINYWLLVTLKCFPLLRTFRQVSS